MSRLESSSRFTSRGHLGLADERISSKQEESADQGEGHRTAIEKPEDPTDSTIGNKSIGKTPNQKSPDRFVTSCAVTWMPCRPSGSSVSNGYHRIAKEGSHKALLANPGESSPSNVDVLPLHDTTANIQIATCRKLEIWIARRRV